VCVCVCEKEREMRERVKEWVREEESRMRGREKETNGRESVCFRSFFPKKWRQASIVQKFKESTSVLLEKKIIFWKF